MTPDDATAATLAALLDEQEAAEAAVRRAAFALSEAEELAEEDAPARATVGVCQARLESAELRLAEVRERRRRIEAEMEPGEVLRAHVRR